MYDIVRNETMDGERFKEIMNEAASDAREVHNPEADLSAEGSHQ